MQIPCTTGATIEKTAGAQEPIPFHRASIGEEEALAVAEVVRSGWLTMGPRTFQFEREFADYVGAKHAIAVSSCTAALHVALEAIGLTAGDEVILPTNTFTATAEVVTYFHARPVFADIDPVTLSVDFLDVERKITGRTKAIIPVHYGGQPCDMAELAALAAVAKLRVIEDAAHALPASYRGVSVGSISELTAFSFYATKTLCTGEGGMITTNDDELAGRMGIMRLHGISRDAWKRYGSGGSWKYEVVAGGFKYNMTDIQAALGLTQLHKCDEMNEARRKIAKEYDEAFTSETVLETPSIREDRRSAWHLYPLRLNLEQLTITRDGFIAELQERGIGTSVHFIPLHLQPFYRNRFGYRSGDLPVSEREFKRYLSLPIFPNMTEEEIQRVIENVRNIAQRSRR